MKNIRNFLVDQILGRKKVYIEIFMYPNTENPAVIISGYCRNGIPQLKIKTIESENISQHGPYDGGDTTVITMVGYPEDNEQSHEGGTS